MRVFKNILFPIDFSECSEMVLPYALDMAERFDAQLHLLFVAQDLSYLSTNNVGPQPLMNMTRDIALAGEKEMQTFCEKHLRDFSRYEAKVVIGNPEEKILRYAIEVPIDLIIMGTHGRRGLDRVLMGSVAEQVLKNAAAPVLTVSPFRPKVQYVHM